MKRWFTGLVAALSLALGVTSCTPHISRAQARSALLAVAEGVALADKACGTAARALDIPDGVKLATACVKAYRSTRSALETAEGVVDAWAANHDKQFLCAASHVARAFTSFTGVLTGAGVSLSPAIADGVSMASWLGTLAGGACKELPSADR